MKSAVESAQLELLRIEAINKLDTDAINEKEAHVRRLAEYIDSLSNTTFEDKQQLMDSVTECRSRVLESSCILCIYEAHDR